MRQVSASCVLCEFVCGELLVVKIEELNVLAGPVLLCVQIDVKRE